jgi:Ion channel
MERIRRWFEQTSQLAEQFGVQVLFWVVILAQTRRHNLPWWVIGLDIGLLAYNITSLALLARRAGVTLLRLALGLISVLSLLLANFSWFYWEAGGGSNFTAPLTHLDAVYFTVGTLSTAGTGTLSAVSQSARALQTAQMAIDLMLTLFAVSVVVSRFATPLRVRRASSGQSAAIVGTEGEDRK